MKSRAFKWWNCLEINSFGTVFRIYFAPRKCKIAHISSLVPFWPGEVTSRRVESSDVAGVTRACSNLQILFHLYRNLPQLNFLPFARGNIEKCTYTKMADVIRLAPTFLVFTALFLNNILSGNPGFIVKHQCSLPYDSLSALMNPIQKIFNGKRLKTKVLLRPRRSYILCREFFTFIRLVPSNNI